MWSFCLRCVCQVQLVVLKSTAKNFSAAKPFCCLFSTGHALCCPSGAWCGWGSATVGRGSKSLCISRHRGNRATGQHARVGSWLCCSLPCQRTESSLHHISNTGGQGMDIPWTGSVQDSQSVPCVFREGFLSVKDLLQLILCFSLLFFWISLMCRISAQNPSYWCFMVSYFHYLTITKRRSCKWCSIKSRS